MQPQPIVDRISRKADGAHGRLESRSHAMQNDSVERLDGI
jgi:hypothetical protein